MKVVLLGQMFPSVGASSSLAICLDFMTLFGGKIFLVR